MNWVLKELGLSLNLIFWTCFDKYVLYGPSKNTYWSPDADQKPTFEYFTPKMGIHCLFYYPKPGEPVIVFCHGSTGNNSMRKYVHDSSRMLNMNILVWDYPGFGHTMAKDIHHNKNFLASDEVVETLVSKFNIPIYDLCFWGESIGGTFAAYLAQNYPDSRCLILWSAFSSLSDMLKDHGYQFLHRLRKNTQLEDLATKKFIENVTIPILIVHSKSDKIVPFDNSLRNFKHATDSGNQDVYFYEIFGGHSQPLVKLDDLFIIKRFVNQSSLVEAEGVVQ